MRRHEREIHDEKRYPCTHCGKKFKRKSDARRHVANVHERRAIERHYKCNDCGEEFANLAPFQAHQGAAHPKKKGTKRPATNESGGFYHRCENIISIISRIRVRKKFN